MRAGRVFVGVTVLGLLLMAGTAALYWWILRPPPQSPDLVQRAPPASAPAPVLTRTAAAPDDLERCPLEVEVTSRGAPLPGARVRVTLHLDGERYSQPRCTTDEDGACRYPEAPCGRANAYATADSHTGSLESIPDTREAALMHLELAPGVLLDGRVTDSYGAPLEGALVSLEGEGAQTGADGNYQVWVTPGASGAVQAHKDGYLEQRREVHMPRDGGVTLDFALALEHRVTVYCAGLPDDSCDQVQPGVLCTHPALLFGEVCRGDPTECVCPGGAAAIRGGGEAVRVEADQDVAWLDFRYGGGIEGRTLFHGEPVEECAVELVRVPRGLVEDLPRGLLTARSAPCDRDGRFLVEGLRPGLWRAGVMLGELEAVYPEIRIEDAIVDLGDVELSAGGNIEGRLVDGLTGEPVDREWVTVTLAHEGVIAMPVTGDMAREGRFTLTGLPPGDYLVFAGRNPAEPVEVTLVGEDTVWVELESWAADTPEDQGFSLVTGGAGELVIDRVDAGGAAEGVGMATGDVVTGVKILGFDLNTLHPQASEAALRYYPGPGMSLVLDRQGESVEIDLD